MSKMKSKIPIILNIIFIIIIMLLVWGYIAKSRTIQKLKVQNRQVAEAFEKQLEDYSQSEPLKTVWSDDQFHQECRRRRVYVFRDYKGKKFKPLNTAFKYVINKKNNMVHKVVYPGGSSAYATRIENREYRNELKKHPSTPYNYCSYCFPEGPPSK